MNQLALDPQPTPEVYRIPLTRGQFAIVDKEDFDWLSKWKWNACWMKNSNSFYAIRTTPTIAGKRQTILMSRQIMDFPEGRMVDHWNHDTLDNRRRNLRVATNSQNNRNARLRKDSRTGIRGVNYFKHIGKWGAYVRVNGTRKHLGVFDTKQLAAEARRLAAAEAYGEFDYSPSPAVTSL